MYTVYSAGLLPSDAELSRRAAERYAVLAAVRESRSPKHHAWRRPRIVPARPHGLATSRG